MTEKTARQIENMKNDYNFGVEIEMNHITRRKAAEVAAEFFGTGRYENTACRNGYMSWSAWDQQGREWKFQRDVSIAGPDEFKCEAVSPILETSDIADLQELVRRLRRAGGVSNPGVGAGVHLHISRKDGFTVRDIKNLVKLCASHEALIGAAIGIDPYRMHRYCRPVNPDFLDLLERKNPKTMEELEDCWYEGNNADYGREQHYNPSRYAFCNLHSFFHGHHTVEIRGWQFENPHDGKKGGLHAGQLKAMIQFTIGLAELAHEVKYASAKPQQTENPKFALRTFMLRMGFIGEEFKTARDFFLGRLEGDAAFRFGR